MALRRFEPERIPASPPEVEDILIHHPDWYDEGIGTTEAALFLGITPGALNAMHNRKIGPPFAQLKDGGKRTYTRRDLIQFMRKRVVAA